MMIKNKWYNYKKQFRLFEVVFDKLRIISKNIFSISWIDTIRINSKLPFKQFVKMPIFLYGSKIDMLNGTICIRNDIVTTGMIHLGQRTSGFCGSKNGIFISISGGAIFKGPGYMGNNSVIEIGKNGTITFGRNFGITGAFKIASHSRIKIGDNFSSSWDVGIYDTDFHFMENVETHMKSKLTIPITIGDDCWICQRCLILKGSYLPQRSVLASCSLLNASYKNISPNTIYAGTPARPIKEGWTREEFIRFEKYPIGNIVKQLGLQ